MTKHTNLLEQFLSPKNFQDACKRVVAKATYGGIDQVASSDFANHGSRELEKLISSLKNGKYIPEPVSATYILKLGNKGGYRELGLPTVADKIVQTALLQVVEPLAERIFLDTSYGYRPGRGAYKALRRVEHYLGNRHLRWLANQDIECGRARSCIPAGVNPAPEGRPATG